MTNNDVETNANPGLRKAIVSIVGGITLVFLAGLFAGFTTATFDHGGPTAKDAGIMLVMVAMIAAVALACWKLWPQDADEPISNRTRKARNWMYVLVGFGIIAGFGLLV